MQNRSLQCTILFLNKDFWAWPWTDWRLWYHSVACCLSISAQWTYGICLKGGLMGGWVSVFTWCFTISTLPYSPSSSEIISWNWRICSRILCCQSILWHLKKVCQLLLSLCSSLIPVVCCDSLNYCFWILWLSAVLHNQSGGTQRCGLLLHHIEVPDTPLRSSQLICK